VARPGEASELKSPKMKTTFIFSSSFIENGFHFQSIWAQRIAAQPGQT
jgi:hypothetical protein